MVTQAEYAKNEYAAEIITRHYNRTPGAFVRSFGCQQSVNDGERIKGVLQDIGFQLVDAPEQADLVLFNTCAVREHAEQRVFGNVGALKALKEGKPGLLLGLCGCMAQEKSTIEKLRESYPYVDMVLGVNAAQELPQALVEKFTTRKRALRLPPQPESLVEGLPHVRESAFKAFVPIMYGCDNYCSYCIVPYVRGRERSRASADIRREFEGLVEQGYREITLLGQNVNSYGKGLEEKLDFSDLLAQLAQTPGNYVLRFMTSHPKDATRKMVDTMAANSRLCKHLHLPVQSGSNEVLSRMNRKYTVEDYLGLIRYAKSVCPAMTFSSDIMVGFPGETEEDFQKSLALVEEVGFTQLFTFIYSKRPGTEAAEQPDDTPRTEKADRIERLLALQEKMVAQVAQPWMGQQFAGLVEGAGRQPGVWQARLNNNMLLEFPHEEDLSGQFVNLRALALRGALLQGELLM